MTDATELHLRSNEVPALQCQQEEAGVVISSEDIDVFIIPLAFHDKIGASLFQKCATRIRTRVVDIRTVASTLGIDVCRALVGMHSQAVTLLVFLQGKGSQMP